MPQALPDEYAAGGLKRVQARGAAVGAWEGDPFRKLISADAQAQ